MKVISIALLALLTACASDTDKLGQDAAKLVEFKPTAKIEVRWDKAIGSAGNTLLRPAISHDAIYVANARGKISRLDRANGKRAWRTDSGYTLSAGVGSGNDLVLIGGMKGELTAYGENGKVRWKTKVSSEVLSPPQVADGIVIVRTDDGRIAGLDAADGKRLWLYEYTTPALVVRNHAGVAIQRGTIYVGFAGGKLAAISLTNGTALWESAVSQPHGNTELERISDITSTPVVDNDQVCAVAFQGRVACFGLIQGNLLWARDLSSDAGLALLDKTLYLTDADGAVLALDKSNGSSIWKNDQLRKRRTTAPYIAGDHLVVGDHEGYLHVMKRENGAMEARLPTDGSAIVAAPVELDGGMLVQTHDGGLYSIAIH
ncbi:MAG: outer membrane protein assembly factor BamB [Gallionellaceae bacterium]|nr:outer membrane protein assembly factor BamB [Gallionellaceae bacterium]